MTEHYIDSRSIAHVREVILHSVAAGGITDANGKMVFARPINTELAEKAWDAAEKAIREVYDGELGIRGEIFRTVDFKAGAA